MREEQLSGRGDRRGGLLRRRVFLCWLLALAALSPLVYFRETLLAPATSLPGARPRPNEEFGDPLVNLSVMGRAWHRWEDGDFSLHDERVFAPYPDTWPLGEPLLAPAAIGYPVYKLTGSYALGYNLGFYLACFVAVLGAGLLFGRLAGHGIPALAGALLYGWCPGRLNNFGVLMTMWAGFVPLVLYFILRFLRGGKTRHALLAAFFWTVLALGSLYGLLMGSIAIGIVLLLLPTLLFGRPGRLVILVASFAAALSVLVRIHTPFLGLEEKFDVRVSLENMSGHAANLLSLLHHGVFSGPLRSLLDTLVPGFPEGASALFPTLTVISAFGAAWFLARLKPATGTYRPRPERTLLPWICLSAITFILALGPDIRFGEHELFPGPYRLLAGLPVFRSLRGLHRWDQWFGFGLIAAAVIVWSRLFRSQSRRTRMAMTALLGSTLLLDLFPRAVASPRIPGPSPLATELDRLDKDAIVAIYPFERLTSEAGWVEQLYHRRRVLNGFQSFPPPIHYWLSGFCSKRPLPECLAAYRELGATYVEFWLPFMPQSRRAELEAWLATGSTGGIQEIFRRPGRVGVRLERKEPILVDPASLSGLVFEGTNAVFSVHPGRLVFRLGGTELPVRVETPKGSYRDVFLVPPVAASRLSGSLGRVPPPGASVFSRTGRLLGTVRAETR